jgi:hypothetical protein
MSRCAGSPGRRAVTIGVFAILTHFACGSASGPRPDTPETLAEIAALEAVTVRGKKRERVFEERVSAFVSSLTVRSYTESLARWPVPVCPYVAGASTEQNDYIRHHLRLRDWWSQDHFEAELSFVAETSYYGERKPGDHVQVYGDVEYLDEGDG